MAAAGDPPPLTLKDPAGSSLADPETVRSTVAANLKALHEARPELRQIYYGPLEGLYFRTPQGWTVYLGDDGPLSSKLDLLVAVERGILAGTIARPEVVDLRFGGQAQLR